MSSRLQAPANDAGYDNEAPPGQEGYIYDPQQYYTDGYDQYDETQNPMQEFYNQQQYANQGAQEQYPRMTQEQQQQYYAEQLQLQQQQQQDGGNNNVDELPVADNNKEVQLQAVQAQLLRTYEFEDWVPTSNGWFADICTESFFSLAFRLHFVFFHYCAGVVIFFLSINYIFATLFRMFYPPLETTSPVWQTMAYFVIFFLQSFTTAAVYCTGVDMLKGFLRASRNDVQLWGFSHQSYTKLRPPFVVHMIVVWVSTIGPFIWAVIVTLVNSQTVFYIAQQYFYLTVLVHMWYVAICYAWFYWLALREKKRAYGRRSKVDDLNASVPRPATAGSVPKLKKSWYHCDVVLEEYGLESRTIVWSVIVFLVGLIPLFAIYATIARQTRNDVPDNAWVAIGLIFITILLFLQQFSTKKYKPHRAAFMVIFLIVLLIILGLIGCAVAASGPMFGILIIFAFASQFMLLRKRSHQLSRREVCALMNVALDREMEEVKSEHRWDTYLCCCRNTMYTYIGCCDVKKYFGYRHPAVREREKQLAVERINLRTDQKVLLCFWFIVSLFLVIVLGINNVMYRNWNSKIATKTAPIPASSSPLPVCSLVYNAKGAVPFRAYDLALLSALGYQYGNHGDQDFAQWFTHTSNLIRKFPSFLPSTQTLAMKDTHLTFAVYSDISNGFTVIVVASRNRGMQFMRNLDRWGESIALQLSEIMAPVVYAWPEEAKRAFVKGASFLKQSYGEADPLVDVAAYINANPMSANNTILVGESWAGGYVKILAARTSLPFVVFNAPGTSYMSSLINTPNNNDGTIRGTQIVAERAITNYIDKNYDAGQTYFVPCPDSVGAHTCGDIQGLVASLAKSCGDEYGRQLEPS